MIGALLRDARDRDDVAFTAASRSTDYSYRKFCTGAWKAGNLFSHYGVHQGATVTVLVGSPEPDDELGPGRLGATPEPLLAILGAWLLGGVVDLDPGEPVDGAVVVGPSDSLERWAVAPGCTRLAYGDAPSDPSIGQFERERWSENPVEPPNDVSPDAVALAGQKGTTQHALVESARTAVSEERIRASDRVGIDAPVGPTVLAFGVLAPLAAGATIVGGDIEGVDVRVDDSGVTRLSD